MRRLIILFILIPFVAFSQVNRKVIYPVFGIGSHVDGYVNRANKRVYTSNLSAPLLLSAVTGIDEYNIILTFSKNMSSGITGANFTFSGNNIVTSATVVGAVVTLHLFYPYTWDETITLSTVAAVHSADGNTLATLTNYAVTNGIPGIVSAVTSTNGYSIILTYNIALNSTMANSAFIVYDGINSLVILSLVLFAPTQIAIQLATPCHKGNDIILNGGASYIYSTYGCAWDGDGDIIVTNLVM